jgi:serine protease AprX
VVAAAGNEGNAPDAVSYAPGNDPYVISAGATDDRATRTVLDDVLAPWSSRGLTQDGVKKPEVLAPGTRLSATLALHSDLQDLCKTCVEDKRYFRMGGTSMSTALVSGVSALLLQAHPGWTPDQVKGALHSTLVDVPGVGGEVNAMRALDATRLTSNQGLVPNELIVPETGLIDFGRASFRRASFRDAGGKYDSRWSRASFRCECVSGGADGIDPARASYRRASFRRTASVTK